ncbi:hypothetical protein JXL21_06675 [Candidatus Bathyarchaeota archaeon]|nr:hypothetical protein [Candidatus Bathyarchaeota archaeon]
MVSIEQVLYIIPLLALTASITYYALVLNNQNKTRQTQLFMNLYTQMRSKEFVRDTRELSSWTWKDFTDFRSKYGSRADKDANTLFHSTANFFDGIGVLVEHKELAPRLVEELMSSWIIWFWEKFGEIIIEYRKVSYPQYLEKVEFLYDKIKPLAAKEHPQFKA